MDQNLISISDLSNALCIEEHVLNDLINKIPEENKSEFTKIIENQIFFMENKIDGIDEMFKFIDKKRNVQMDLTVYITIRNKIFGNFYWDRKYKKGEVENFWCGPFSLKLLISDINNKVEQYFLENNNFQKTSDSYGFSLFTKEFKKITDIFLVIAELINFSVKNNEKLLYKFRDEWVFDNSFYTILRYFKRSYERYDFRI